MPPLSSSCPFVFSSFRRVGSRNPNNPVRASPSPVAGGAQRGSPAAAGGSYSQVARCGTGRDGGGAVATRSTWWVELEASKAGTMDHPTGLSIGFGASLPRHLMKCQMFHIVWPRHPSGLFLSQLLSCYILWRLFFVIWEINGARHTSCAARKCVAIAVESSFLSRYANGGGTVMLSFGYLSCERRTTALCFRVARLPIYFLSVERRLYYAGIRRGFTAAGLCPPAASRMPVTVEDVCKLRPYMRHYCQGVHSEAYMVWSGWAQK